MEKRVNLEDACSKKYIYLDWNVFKYIKEPRAENEELDRSVKEIVIRTRCKYVYPFSEAYLRDRVNKYKPEYREKVEEDLSFVEGISEGYCLAYRLDKRRIQPIKQSITEVFEQVISLQNEPLDLSAVYPNMVPCKHINLAANVCGSTPINLGEIIKEGVLADILSWEMYIRRS